MVKYKTAPEKHVFSSKERYDNATSNYQACSRINHIKMKKWNNRSELSRTWKKEDLSEDLLLQRAYSLTQTPIMETGRIFAFFFAYSWYRPQYKWKEVPFATLQTSRELESKRFLQLFVGLLLGRHRSAIGHSLVTVPEIFAKVNSVQFSLVSKVTNGVFFPLDFSSFYQL